MKRQCFRLRAVCWKTTILLAAICFATTVPCANLAVAQSRLDNKDGELDSLGMALILEKRLVRVIADAEQSVVSIARIKKPPRDGGQPGFLRLREFDGINREDFIPSDFASGVIIAPLPGNEERFILTNYHAVKGGPIDKQPLAKSRYELRVTLSNRRSFSATIIAADPRSDLAVLRINYQTLKMKPSDLRPLKLTTRNSFRKGQLVLALGNPYAQARDGSASASWGMISNISRRPKPAGHNEELETRRKETIHHYGTLLQVDTRLSLGTSGGALLDLKGQLIGLTTSMAALEGYETTVGYAIPFDAAMRRIVKTLAQGFEVEYGFLGVTPADSVPSQLAGLPADVSRSFAPIASVVHRQSPAGRAGVFERDVILEVNGKPVYDRYDLMRTVGALGPGSIARLLIWRQGQDKLLRIQVKLGKWPFINDEEIIATANRYPSWRGLRVDYPSSRFKYMELPLRFHRAVVVLSVDEAARKTKDLQPGDYITHVNNTLVETPAQFHAAVAKLKGPVTLRLLNGNRVVIAE